MEKTDIEEGDLVLLVAVGGVQGVDVGSLHPVTEQGQEVGGEKYPLESETTASLGHIYKVAK